MFKPRDHAFLLARFREVLRTPAIETAAEFEKQVAEHVVIAGIGPKDLKGHAKVVEAVEAIFLEAVRQVPCGSVEVASVVQYLNEKEAKK